MLKIITSRRISQIFFFALFVWFCVVATLGEQWWQLRGWPVNWFLQLDPLTGLGVLLATHTLYAGLLWGVLTLVLTLFLGRFFCGWVCPMGALQQFVGYLALRKLKTNLRVQRNQPHPAQRIKYWLLLFLLSAAMIELLAFLLAAPVRHPFPAMVIVAVLVAALVLLHTNGVVRWSRRAVFLFVVLLISGMIVNWCLPQTPWWAASLQSGLLDPMPFMHRALNLVLLPLADRTAQVTAAVPRFYQGSGLIGVLFLSVIFLCLRVPRFYCRFICPLGALFGLLSRWSLWRMGKSEDQCRQCHQCEAHCEGGCAPSQVIEISECVLCLNCMDRCRHGLMGYHQQPSAAGEVPGPDLSRRHVVSAMAAGLLAAPMLRIDGSLAGNWHPHIIRPPGALEEAEFLTRCIKCGQCMRVCPTNVIHPAGWQAGPEALWTPVLNFRIGTSGCQHNCVACSYVCPTAALRPISVDERMGRKAFADAGPLRTGMAFVDHGRCLPWAMDTPCIVCQENCPVSPKAIFTRTEYRVVRNGAVRAGTVEADRITITGSDWPANTFGSGDFFVVWKDQEPIPIRGNTGNMLFLKSAPEGMVLPAPGHAIQVVVRLQKPYVDPRHCIGCGVCEHECPVQGRRAIRVTAENETRQARHRMVLQR